MIPLQLLKNLSINFFLKFIIIMNKVGIAELPLHQGACPSWLFNRMRELAKCISEIIILEYGEREFLKRISNPFFFQSLACVLGFDWHSSGSTTTTCAALKEAINSSENINGRDFSIAIAGGKGKTSRKTEEEIKLFGKKLSMNDEKISQLAYASRMAAKIDNVAIQDNYDLYHHCFIFSSDGEWVVIQQGMNKNNKMARRYHWLSFKVKSFVEEPHNAICCDRKESEVLNMVAKESKEARKISVDLVNDNIASRLTKQKSLKEFLRDQEIKLLKLPKHHEVIIDEKTIDALRKAYEIQPKNYEELIAIKGIGSKSIRALALISELVYGKPASWQDPAMYSFAHGGKDGHPYPVNKKIYDKSIQILRDAIKQAELGNREKLNAIRRLEEFLALD